MKSDSLPICKKWYLQNVELLQNNLTQCKLQKKKKWIICIKQRESREISVCQWLDANDFSGLQMGTASKTAINLSWKIILWAQDHL